MFLTLQKTDYTIIKFAHEKSSKIRDFQEKVMFKKVKSFLAR